MGGVLRGELEVPQIRRQRGVRTMECTFQVGQKVRCIHVGTFYPMIPNGAPRNLVLGATYTIAAIGPSPGNEDGWFIGEISVWLHETANARRDGVDIGYDPRRFRPLVTTKTDISLFQKILEEASKEAKEKV